MKSFARLALTLAGFAFCSGVFAADWTAALTPITRGAFPNPRPFQATYAFGWSGFTAARAEIHERRPAPNRCELDGNVQTIDLVRALWKYDVNHSATADANTLRPVEVKEVEQIQSKKNETHLLFDGNGVTGTRAQGKEAPKTHRTDLQNLFDLHSSLLFLRSQPLRDHDVARIVVYPAKDAYLATVAVQGREKLTVPAGIYSAIKLDLQLSKVGKNGTLQPHKKFRRASVWISDDEDRLLLRIEAQIFIGTIFCELQSLQFEPQKSPPSD